MFTVCDTIDKFLRECYFNNKLIKYIDSSYSHDLPKDGAKFWVSATNFDDKREVKLFSDENGLYNYLFNLSFKNLMRLKISTKEYDLMVIDKLIA